MRCPAARPCEIGPIGMPFQVSAQPFNPTFDRRSMFSRFGIRILEALRREPRRGQATFHRVSGYCLDFHVVFHVEPQVKLAKVTADGRKLIAANWWGKSGLRNHRPSL